MSLWPILSSSSTTVSTTNDNNNPPSTPGRSPSIRRHALSCLLQSHRNLLLLFLLRFFMCRRHSGNNNTQHFPIFFFLSLFLFCYFSQERATRVGRHHTIHRINEEDGWNRRLVFDHNDFDKTVSTKKHQLVKIYIILNIPNIIIS